MDKKYTEYLLKKTKEDYNLIADDFSRTRSSAWPEIGFLAKDYLRGRKREKVLDLGCGNGRLYEFFRNKNIDYIGMDSSEKLIDLARKKYPGGRFEVGNALNLHLASSYFDKIYSIAVLHQIPSQEFRLQFLKETQRVLKPEGILILTVWKFHRLKDLLLLFKYTILKLIGKSKLDFKDIFEPWGKKTERYYHWFSKRELRNLIREVGFKVKEIGLTKSERGNRQNIYLIAEK